jgi:hypothetical protein
MSSSSPLWICYSPEMAETALLSESKAHATLDSLREIEGPLEGLGIRFFVPNFRDRKGLKRIDRD